MLNSLNQSELDEFDFLVFMRGGGSGIEIFDDKDLCKGIIELGMPFIVAIGHAVDTPFLHKLADLSFITPSAFGTFLREIRDDVASEASILLSQEKEISRLDGELKQLSTNYEKRIQGMEFNYHQRQLHFERSISKQRKIAIYIIAVLVIVLYLVLYFK